MSAWNPLAIPPAPGVACGMLRQWIIPWMIPLALLLAGCGRSPRHLDREIEDKTARIVELERRLRDQQAEHVRTVEELRRELAWTKDKLRHDAEEHRRQVLVKDRAIADGEAELAMLRRERAASLPPPAPEPGGAPAPAPESLPLLPPPEAQFKVLPEAGNADLFPLTISGVEGRSLASGTHTVMRKVETGDTYKDDLGVVRQHFTWEQGVVTQYTTTVSFSLENLTRTPQRAFVRAGAASREVVLAPGEIQEGLSIQAARGSKLLVVVGGRSRSVDVEYAD